jgi:hypothetical protein
MISQQKTKLCPSVLMHRAPAPEVIPAAGTTAEAPLPTICQIRTICRKALYVKYTQYVRYAQYIKYAQYVEKAQIAAQYVKYAQYNKKKLIGIQNRLPGFASTPPGTGCHKHIFVVVFSAISGFCPRSYHRSLQLEKPRRGAAGAEVAERPGSAEACAHGFSTEIRSNA